MTQNNINRLFTIGIILIALALGFIWYRSVKKHQSPGSVNDPAVERDSVPARLFKDTVKPAKETLDTTVDQRFFLANDSFNFYCSKVEMLYQANAPMNIIDSFTRKVYYWRGYEAACYQILLKK